MRLNEWQDAKGNKVNITSPATSQGTSSGSSTTGFKKRFEKLLDYAKNHKGPEINKAEVKSLSDDGFFYTEKIRGGYSYYDRDIQVYIGSQTEAWRLKIYIDNEINEDLAGQGWPELLKTLRAYITVPVTTTLEYKELLTEWIDSSGKKVNTSGSTSSPPAAVKPLNTVYYEGGGVAKKVREKAQRVVVTSKVDEIYANTFNSCEELEEVILPETVKRIDNFAFYNCIRLEKINLPSGISYIADGAFDRCDNLTIHCEKDSYADKFATDHKIPVVYTNTSTVAEDFKIYENLWD